MEIIKKKAKALAVVLIMSIMVSSNSVQPPVQVSAKVTYVYVASSGNGKCYHNNRRCSNMKGVNKVSVKWARSHGFRACKKCY